MAVKILTGQTCQLTSDPDSGSSQAGQEEMKNAYTAAGKILNAEQQHDASLAEQLRLLKDQKPIIVPGRHDRIHNIFNAMSVNYEVRPYDSLTSYLDSRSPRPVFINCGPFVAPSIELIAALRDYVHAGAALVTTDWCLKYIVEPVFPGFIAWNQKETEGKNESFPVDKGMNESDKASWFVEAMSYPLSILKINEVRRILESKAFAEKYACDRALAVTWTLGKGSITHYVSHLYAQMVELRDEKDAMSGAALASEIGVAPSVLGDLADKTRLASVRSAHSTMLSVVKTATQAIDVGKIRAAKENKDSEKK